MNRNYAVNNLNQYTSAGPASFSYDNNGNLTGDGSHSFVYDALNRLTSRSGGGTAALVYDPLGRLLQTSGGSAGTTKFLYDGDELVAEYASNGSTILRRYVHGAGVDDPLVWYEGAGLTDKRYLIVNERGSIINVANASGGTIQINSYNDWGIPSATNLGRFQYTGQIWLPELGVYYYKARLYSPTLGRFMQTDPIGYEDGMNTYAYAGNDPMNGRDPTGLAVSSVPSCSTRIGCTSVVLDTSGTNGAAQGTQNAAAQNSNGNASEGSGTGRSLGIMDPDKYWPGQEAKGDPIAGTARQFGGPQSEMSLLVRHADAKLQRALELKHATGYRYVRLDAKSKVKILTFTSTARANIAADRASIRIGLARAHNAALEANGGQWLSSGVIRAYHHQIFEQHGLPASTFGGSSGLERIVPDFIWCRGCP